jgi:hypothetical protein
LGGGIRPNLFTELSLCLDAHGLQSSLLQSQGKAAYTKIPSSKG